MVDCVAAYRNTLGVVVANEIINSIPSTAAAPVIRALTRDVKRYMALAAELTGQRVLPVGVNSADVPILRRPQLDYFTAGDESETIDFYAVSSHPPSIHGQECPVSCRTVYLLTKSPPPFFGCLVQLLLLVWRGIHAYFWVRQTGT